MFNKAIESNTGYVKLLLPIAFDGMLDGVVLGTMTSVSIKAGVILAIVNTIEMGALGSAFASKIKELSISTSCKLLVIMTPPLAMLVTAIISAKLTSDATDDNNFTFVALLAFGVVCLLQLSVMDLIPRSNDDNNEIIILSFFAGFLLIFVINLLEL